MLIDTPGIGAYEIDEEKKIQSKLEVPLINAIKKCARNNNLLAILLVLGPGRVGKESVQCLKAL